MDFFFFLSFSIFVYTNVQEVCFFFVAKGHISYLYIYFLVQRRKKTVFEIEYINFLPSYFPPLFVHNTVLYCFAYRYLTPYLLYINFQCNILWLDLKTRTLYTYSTWYLCFVIFPSTQRKRIFYGSWKVFYECKILELNWVDSEET